MTARPAVVGGFILGALALGVVGILFFGGTHLFATRSRVVVFFTESVAGLEVGAPVTFQGVRVGSVQSIAIRFSTDTMAARIPVYLDLESNRVIWEGKQLGGSAADIGQMVEAGLRAQLAMQSVVTGQLRVDFVLRPGAPAQPTGALEGAPEIPTVPSDLGQLKNELQNLPLREVADAAEGALTSLGRLSDHLDTRLDPLLDSAGRAADLASQTLQRTDGAVRQVQTEASTALHDLDGLLVDARRQLDARGGELGRILTDADRTVGQAQTLLDSVNGLADARSDFRGNLEATVRDLAASASSLRNFTDTLERNPNALLMGRTSQ